MKIIDMLAATEADRLIYQQKCIKFREEFEALVKKHGIMPYPGYDPGRFDYEPYRPGKHDEVLMRFICSYIYGVLVD